MLDDDALNNSELSNEELDKMHSEVFSTVDDMFMAIFGTDDIEEASEADNEEALSKISNDFLERIDDRIDAMINDILNEAAVAYNYTVADLDSKVNTEQTLREYIRDTEMEFGQASADIESMSAEELNNYIKKLDTFWRLDEL